MANHAFLSVVLLTCLRESLGGIIMGKFLTREMASVYNKNTVERPCPGFDVNCVREYFANNAACDLSYGPVPDPLFVRTMVPFSKSNITLMINKLQVRGLNGKIVEFYVNRQTDRVVLAVSFRRLSLSSPDIDIRFYPKAKEPVVIKDYLTSNIDEITITAIFPRINNIQLVRAEIAAYLDDGSPSFSFGPNIGNSQDPRILAALNVLVNNFSDNLKEAFTVLGPIFMSAYIQQNICDFGLN